jgi:hypothetical protein
MLSRLHEHGKLTRHGDPGHLWLPHPPPRPLPLDADSEFDDGASPKFPGCDNTFQKVKKK